jgi:hypothetical protein
MVFRGLPHGGVRLSVVLGPALLSRSVATFERGVALVGSHSTAARRVASFQEGKMSLG